MYVRQVGVTQMQALLLYTVIYSKQIRREESEMVVRTEAQKEGNKEENFRSNNAATETSC